MGCRAAGAALPCAVRMREARMRTTGGAAGQGHCFPNGRKRPAALWCAAMPGMATERLAALPPRPGWPRRHQGVRAGGVLWTNAATSSSTGAMPRSGQAKAPTSVVWRACG